MPSLVLLAVSTSSHSHERPHEGHSRRGVCRCALYPSSVDDDGDVVMHEEDCSFLTHHLDTSPTFAPDDKPRSALTPTESIDKLMKLMAEKNASFLQRFQEVEEDRRRAEAEQRAVCVGPRARREAVVNGGWSSLAPRPAAGG